MESVQHIVAKVAAQRYKSPLARECPLLVAASKNQSPDAIEKRIAEGVKAFGENRVQEAQAKWPELRTRYPHLSLHLIGPLQSNKTAQAVALFDVIETVDREKIALTLSQEMHRQGRKPVCYAQVNIGQEPQKTGIRPEKLGEFLTFCREKAQLPITGLMCVPPADEPPAPYFALMYKLAKRYGLKELSMGMSGDYETAIAFGATEIRIGTALFGQR